MAAKYCTTEAVTSVPFTKVSKAQIKLNLSNALSIILTPWPALVMAIENSFGGPDTRDKAEWLKEVVADYVMSNKSIDRDDLESFILSIMESEFNTLVEDGSCSKLCDLIIRVYSAILLNDHVETEQVLSPFRLLSSHRITPTTPRVLPASVSNQEFESLQVPTEMTIDTPQQKSVDSYQSSPTSEYTESGEWQLVTRSKRKKN